jgi:hypothetical protein
MKVPQDNTSWMFDRDQGREELNQIQEAEREIFLEDSGVTERVKPLPPDNLSNNLGKITQLEIEQLYLA